MFNIFVDGIPEQYKDIGSGSLIDVGGGTTWGEIYDFTCNHHYEIPFAMTEDEIAAVYDDEKFVIHT